MAAKKVGTFHFRISGEFITRISRNLAAEGNYAKAFSILMKGVRGMTQEIALQIISGKKRLDGWNSRIKLCPDNARVDSRGIALPGSITDIIEQRDREVALLKSERDDIVQRAEEYLDRLEYKAYYGPATLSFLHGVEDIVGPPQTPKATTDWLLWSNGWLSPDGLFYGCEYRGHIRLAMDLGFEDGMAERHGWQKFQTGAWIEGMTRKPITQKQIDTIFDWSLKTQSPMPGWVTEAK